MGTFLSSPEEYVVKIGQPANSFHLMIKGDCIVELTNQHQETYMAEKLLVEGQHFGEIGLLYQCKRTASVISRNYLTIAHMSR